MFKKIESLFLFGLLSVVMPAGLQAVAVPQELLELEPADSQGMLYGFIVLVFVAGIALGIWMHKRNHQR